MIYRNGHIPYHMRDPADPHTVQDQVFVHPLFFPLILNAKIRTLSHHIPVSNVIVQGDPHKRYIKPKYLL